MQKVFVFSFLAIGLGLPSIPILVSEGGILIDHNDTDITALSQETMQLAKDTLHIAYGHTSHGSQLTDGMTGLVAFANGGGLGLSLPTDFFDWGYDADNSGGGAYLDLHDYAMSGDVGYYPQWVNNTTNYLNHPAHSDINVIIWSWCGQVSNKYANGTLDSEYLTPMSDLETAYPHVTFVYMTGHVDHWDDADNKGANQMIRDYCAANNKVLYDFAAIESYDPEGTFYEFPDDNCDYYASESGPKLGNWADEWQNTHTEGVDWFNTSAAHSRPLNGNRKAYAAWALWVAIAAERLDADFDNDGDIDGSDFLTWQQHYGLASGAIHAQGDANRDTAVDGQDLTVWQDTFGTIGGSGISLTPGMVPEPGCLMLTILTFLLISLIRLDKNACSGIK
ncbi:MAG: hypothetical protein JW829_07535 [Pirellulales bacterium]|nr:hypothetical protein [Pirellulales bacterium]